MLLRMLVPLMMVLLLIVTIVRLLVAATVTRTIVDPGLFSFVLRIVVHVFHDPLVHFIFGEHAVVVCVA